jgi:DNA-binding MarR family transcriptional regulator
MPKFGTHFHKSVSFEEGQKELLLSSIMRTTFTLQVCLDRRFLVHGTTFQEATVLMRCAEAGEIAPSKLALTLARDKGKITRFIDRLEASKLVKRQVNPQDRRFSIIRPTAKGKFLARRIASTFELILRDLFIAVLDSDIERLSRILPQLHRNAVVIGSKQWLADGRRKRGLEFNKIIVGPAILPRSKKAHETVTSSVS